MGLDKPQLQSRTDLPVRQNQLVAAVNMTTGRFVVTIDPGQIGASRFLPARFHAHLVLGFASARRLWNSCASKSQ
jgi:hypothetical protein